MFKWFVALIPAAVLILTLFLASITDIFISKRSNDLIARAGKAETMINEGGGLVKIDGKLIFVESFGCKIEKNTMVLLVKYIKEDNIYKVEPYV